MTGLSGCDQQENAAAKVEYDGLSNSQPLRVDANNHTVTMLVQINSSRLYYRFDVKPCFLWRAFCQNRVFC
ncbi:hypothetical protein O5626_28435, partial [Escherichia coli]|nr:hypothetical protein [Escherichia coli]